MSKKNNYESLAKIIVEKVGGEKNILALNHCVTRLRFNLKNDNLADTEGLSNIGEVASVINRGGQYQVVIGPAVSDVYKAIMLLINIESSTTDEIDSLEAEKKKGVIARVLDTIASMFVAVIPPMAGAGMLKAVLSLVVAFHLIEKTSETFKIINFISDAPFYFLPILLADAAAKKFKVNSYMAMTVAGVLLHPAFDGLKALAKESGNGIHLLGLPITITNYGSSVVPIILTVWFMSYVEPVADKLSPKIVKMFMKPLITLAISAPVALIAIGPLGNILGIGLGNGVNSLNQVAGWLVPMLVGALTPLMVMTGMHYGLIPIGINNLATTGIDTVAGPGMMVSNIAQGGAALGVAIRSKKSDMKQLASSTGITAILGITEPAMYGVILPYKKPLIASMLGGAIGGLFLGIMGVGRFSLVAPGLLALPSYIGGDGLKTVFYAAIGCFIAFVISLIASLILGIDEKDSELKKKVNNQGMPSEDIKKNSSINYDKVYSPIQGITIALKDINDSAFSAGKLGKGIGIIPSIGKVFSPISGIVTVYETKHAVGIEGINGTEVLIHVGIDTVKLEGRHFKSNITSGQNVKQGELLIEFDIDKIKAEGYDLTTPVIVSNTGEYTDVLGVAGKNINPGELLLSIIQ